MSWRVVCCGEVSSCFHEVVKTQLNPSLGRLLSRHSLSSSLLLLLLLLVFPLLMGVLWMLTVSVMVLRSLRGHINSSPGSAEPGLRTNAPSSEPAALGAGVASAPNWRKMRGAWSLLVGDWRGAVFSPLAPVVVVALMRNSRLKPSYSSAPFLKNYTLCFMALCVTVCVCILFKERERRRRRDGSACGWKRKSQRSA